MKKIPLANDKGIALVDDEDFPLLSRYKWFHQPNKNTSYAATRIRIGEQSVQISMHRLVVNAPNGNQVDHCDNNGLNNQKSNLRFCTSQENNRNRRKLKNCSSIYKGVYWNKPIKKWVARIRINGHLSHLGCFSSETKAGKAYDKLAKKTYGDFARLNFPEEK